MNVAEVTITSWKPDDACMAWLVDGARYHIWFDPSKPIRARNGVLYKNSVNSAILAARGQHRTKHLKADNIRNRTMIGEARLLAERYDMVAQAKQAAEEKDAAEIEKRKGATRRYILERHGPELWNVLLLTEEVMRDLLGGARNRATDEITAMRVKIAAELDKATAVSL